MQHQKFNFLIVKLSLFQIFSTSETKQCFYCLVARTGFHT